MRLLGGGNVNDPGQNKPGVREHDKVADGGHMGAFLAGDRICFDADTTLLLDPGSGPRTGWAMREDAGNWLPSVAYGSEPLLFAIVIVWRPWAPLDMGGGQIEDNRRNSRAQCLFRRRRFT